MTRSFLMTALLLGICAEWLLWGVRAGPGGSVLVLLACFSSHVLRRRLERPVSPWTWWLWLAAAALAASQALYDSEVVHAVAPALCWTVTGLAMFHTVAASDRLERLPYHLPLGVSGLSESWSAARVQSPRLSFAALRGVALAIPILGVFGGLFLMADPAYATSWQAWLGNWSEAAASGFRLLLWSWLLAAIFWQARRGAVFQAGPVSSPSDSTTWTVALGLTDLLFLTFLHCQSHYLFSHRAPAGMTLAEYARHGFFELFTASALVVALLTWVHASVGGRLHRNLWATSALMVVLTFGLVLSSALRMQLYVANFGLTLTRAYVLATLLGIVLALLVCLWGMGMRRAPAWLQARLLLLGMLSLAGVGLVNIEAWVARTNLSRPQADQEYLAGLSRDVLPALGAEHAALRARIEQARPVSPDWREWSWRRRP